MRERKSSPDLISYRFLVPAIFLTANGPLGRALKNLVWLRQKLVRWGDYVSQCEMHLPLGSIVNLNPHPAPESQFRSISEREDPRMA